MATGQLPDGQHEQAQANARFAGTTPGPAGSAPAETGALEASSSDDDLCHRGVQLPPDHDQIYRTFLSEIDAAEISDGLATPLWSDVCRRIRHDANEENKFEFLRWPSLGDFSSPESWVPPICYTTLRSSHSWSTKWFRLTRDTKLGRPKDFSRDFGTSPILVQHAYHLLRYEAVTGRSLVDCDVIFEVGGGYASFCRLLKNAGFSGLHIIYDLPHVTAIQRLYLGLSGFEEVSPPEISRQLQHAFCLISDAALNETFDTLAASKLRVGFVATWSLSEFPLPARERVVPRFLDVCSQYLIAYQPYFTDVNNVEYFDSILRRHPELGWQKEEIPPSFYLFS